MRTIAYQDVFAKVLVVDTCADLCNLWGLSTSRAHCILLMWRTGILEVAAMLIACSGGLEVKVAQKERGIN